MRRQMEGLGVVDAKHDAMFVIRPRDVKKASVKDPANCAAAIACRRELHSAAVRVYVTRTYVKQGDKWVRFLTPEAITREIVAFDRGAQFAPGEYRLLAPTKSQQLGQARPSKGGPTRPSKKRRPMHFTTMIRHSVRTKAKATRHGAPKKGR